MDLYTILLSALLILSLVLPGLGFSRRLIATHPELPAFLRLVLLLLVSLIQLCALCFAAAALGVFDPGIIWAFLIVLSIAWLWIYRNEPRLSGVLSDHRAQTMLFLLVLLGGFLSFSHPAEYMSSHRRDPDAGRYSNNASFLLANRGLAIENTLGDLSSELPAKQLTYIPGTYRKNDKYFGAHAHLYPSLLAFVRAHVGIHDSFRLNWGIGILSCLAFSLFLYLASGSRFLAVAGGLLLFSNPACQLFFNRSMSEPITQLLLCSFFCLMILCGRNSNLALAALAAVSLWLLAVCRLEFGFLYSLVPGILLLSYLISDAQPPRHLRLFLLLYLFLLIPLDLYYRNQLSTYAFVHSHKYLPGIFSLAGYEYKDLRIWGTRWWLVLHGSLVLIGIILLQSLPRLFRASWPSRASSRRILGWCLAAAYFGFLVWNLGIRPVGGPPKSASFWGYDHEPINLLRLLWFLDPWTLGLSVFGVAGLFRSTREKAFGILALSLTCLTLVKSGHSTPMVDWWIRRYVPFVIPGLYALSLFGLRSLPRRLGYAAVAASLIFNLVVTQSSIRSVREMQGLYRFYQDLAGVFESGDVQLCFERDTCGRAAVPLHSHFNIPSLYVANDLTPEKLDLVERILRTRDRVTVTHSSQSASPFSTQEMAALTERGLDVELILERSYSGVARGSRDFKKGWKKGDPWWRLYIPAGIFGMDVRKRDFTVRMHRITRRIER